MNAKTINTKFDVTSLPKWAQKNAKVVKLCESSLEFRANVCSAETRQMRELLAKHAAQHYANIKAEYGIDG